MASLSDYLENKVVDWLFRAQVFAPPASFFVALMTTNTTDSNTGGVEVTGAGYARVSVTAALASWAGTQGVTSTVASTGTGGATSNNAPINFPAPTANWGTITGIAIYDAAAAGNLLMHGALTVPKTVNNGDAAPSFPVSSLTFTLA